MFGYFKIFQFLFGYAAGDKVQELKLHLCQVFKKMVEMIENDDNQLFLMRMTLLNNCTHVSEESATNVLTRRSNGCLHGNIRNRSDFADGRSDLAGRRVRQNPLY